MRFNPSSLIRQLGLPLPSRPLLLIMLLLPQRQQLKLHRSTTRETLSSVASFRRRTLRVQWRRNQSEKLRRQFRQRMFQRRILRALSRLQPAKSHLILEILLCQILLSPQMGNLLQLPCLIKTQGLRRHRGRTFSAACFPSRRTRSFK